MRTAKYVFVNLGTKELQTKLVQIESFANQLHIKNRIIYLEE